MSDSQARSPRNTTAATQQDRMATVLDAMVMGPAVAIKHQEAQGQREMLEATTLPAFTRTDGRRGGNQNTQEEFEALGFTFGDPVPGDDLFQQATLPPGWSRKATGYSMWSKIIDERGFERVKIFYKAAFYDRDAFMRLIDVGSDQATLFIQSDREYETEPGYVYAGDIFTVPEGMTRAEVKRCLERVHSEIENVLIAKEGGYRSAYNDRCLARARLMVAPLATWLAEHPEEG